jgi:putative transcriptional regulator
MVSKHPDSEMLVEYTSGALPTAPCISVTTHLQFCENCSRVVDSLKDIGGDLLGNVDPMPVSEGLLEKVLSCLDELPELPQVPSELPVKAIDEIGRHLPRYVRQFLPEGNLNWRFLSPSLRVAAISVGEDSHEVALHKIRAGGKVPEHNHSGSEITVVLKGSFSDEDGVYHPGDFMVREPGDVHRPFAAQNEECVCLSILAAPIKLTGVKGILNPFLRFSPG